MTLCSRCSACQMKVLDLFNSLLPLLVLLNSSVYGLTYHITPSRSIPCAAEFCFTLSHFASSTSKSLSSNTTVIFLPGNHTLDISISLTSSASNVHFMASSSLGAQIICSRSSRFEFISTKAVSINGLVFLDCTGNRFTSVSWISIENCSFFSLDKSSASTATLVIDKSTFGMIHCVFFMDNAKLNHTVEAGGAIAVTHSNVTITWSTFDGNSAEVGGAIFCDMDSKMMINSSVFTSNHIVTSSKNAFHGGCLHSRNCTITVHNCTFDGNNASGYDGGVMSIGQHGDFQSLNSMYITSSTFRNNYAANGGALVVHQGSEVVIIECEFIENKAEINGGSISVQGQAAVNIIECLFNSNIAKTHDGGSIFVAKYAIAKLMISRCNFSFNTACHYGGAVCSWTGNELIMNRSVFSHNGAKFDGGAAVTHYGKITDSKFLNNTANIYGGAIKILEEGTVNLSRCYFSENGAGNGGALYSQLASLVISENVFDKNCAINGVVYLSLSNLQLSNTEIRDSEGSLLLINSEMIVLAGTVLNVTNNTKVDVSTTHLSSPTIFQEGGAITCYQSTITFIGSCLLKYNIGENGGALFTSESKLFVYSELLASENTATSSGGALYLYQSELNCLHNGTVKILSNYAAKRGGGIHAISSIIKVEPPQSRLHIINNLSIKGGGICLETNSKLYALKSVPSMFNFLGNSASIGGAIFVADDTIFGTCLAASTELKFTPAECFMQIAPHTSHRSNYIVTFKSNNATISGSVLFGGLLDRCEVQQFTQLTQQNGVAYFKSLGNIVNNDVISSDPIRICFCKLDKPDCNYKHPTILVKKGEIFTVSVVAVDQVNHTVPATIHSSLSSYLGGLGENQSLQNTSSKCTDLSFTAFSPHESDEIILYADGPCKDVGLSNSIVNVYFLPCTCPVGFQPASEDQSRCDCVCDSRLHPFITTRECTPSNASLTREGGMFWISFINGTGNESGYLIYPYCPLDYCLPSKDKVFFTLNSKNGSDMLCNFNRSGILCGSCKLSLSLSLGSSKCIKCPDNWLVILVTIIISAVLSGIALVALLMMLNITVATGTLNGIIFYVNIINAKRNLFLPFTDPNIFTVFISWLNLELGIDTCFFEGMDTYWKTLVQLIFPAYVIFLSVMIIIVSEQSTNFANTISRRNPLAILDTLILLSYTRLLQTIISVLSFANLEYPDGSREVVWLPDASVKYLQGKHIILFLIAFLIFLAGIAYTLLLFLWQWLLYYQDKTVLLKWVRSQKLCQLLEPYHAPYNFKHRYWTGLLLLVRVIIYVSAAMNVSKDPSVDLLVVETVMICLILLKWQVELRYDYVYKMRMVDLLETVHFIIIIFLSVAMYYKLEAGRDSTILAYISGSLSLLLLLIVLAYHLFTEIVLKITLWIKLKTKPSDAGTDDSPLVECDNDINASQPTISWVDAPPPGEQPLSSLTEGKDEVNCSPQNVRISRSSSVDSAFLHAIGENEALLK